MPARITVTALSELLGRSQDVTDASRRKLLEKEAQEKALRGQLIAKGQSEAMFVERRRGLEDPVMRNIFTAPALFANVCREVPLAGPYISGTLRVCDICGGEPPESIQWQRDGDAISGETGDSYTLQVEDVGKLINALVVCDGVPIETDPVTGGTLTPIPNDQPTSAVWVATPEGGSGVVAVLSGTAVFTAEFEIDGPLYISTLFTSFSPLPQFRTQSTLGFASFARVPICSVIPDYAPDCL